MFVLILLKRWADNELETGSLLHLRIGLRRAGLSRAAADLRYPAGMQGGWQRVAEPKCQPDAHGCEVQVRQRLWRRHRTGAPTTQARIWRNGSR